MPTMETETPLLTLNKHLLGSRLDLFIDHETFF